MDTLAVITDLDTSFNNLEKVVAGFSAEAFTKNPATGCWSAAQVCEHLLLLEKVALAALTGPTIPTNRAADSKIAIIKWAMEDETKRQAPSIVLPSDGNMSSAQFLKEISAEREKLKVAIAHGDITEACTEVKHPALGTLTKLEWIYFTIYHTDRHRRQIEKLVAV